MKKVWVMILLAMFLGGCQSRSVILISPDEVERVIAEKEAVLIDCRTPEEYAEGHIEGAELLPLAELQEKIDELDRDKTYVVICRSGNRSTTFTDSLKAQGFKQVYNVTGGMNDWLGEVVTESQ